MKNKNVQTRPPRCPSTAGPLKQHRRCAILCRTVRLRVCSCTRPWHRNLTSQVYEEESVTPVSVGDTGPVNRLPCTRLLTSAEHARAGHGSGGWGAMTGIPAVTACRTLGSDTHNVTAAQYVLWAPTSSSHSLTTFLELPHGTESTCELYAKAGQVS